MSIKYADIPYGAVNQTINLSEYKRAELVHEDDPAVSVMLDFTYAAEYTIAQDATLNAAIDDIQCSGNHLLLVCNEHQDLVGVITSLDLLGSKPMELMEKKGIERKSMTAAMLMRPIEKIPMITMDEVHMAKVGNIVATLKTADRNHALVTDDNNKICGLFSAAQISKQLHRNIVTNN